MPKLDLRNAKRIKTTAGELSALKGAGFNWTKPATGPATLATFADPNAYCLLTEGGRRASYTGAPGSVANCFSSAPILVPTYMEFDLDSSGGACGAQLYNGAQTAAPEYAPLGQWYGEPGLTVMLSPTWSAVYFASSGLPQQVGPLLLDDLDYAPAISTRVALAARPNGRVWLWSNSLGGWAGGGDPAADTSPTVVLPGTSPLRFGGASSAPTNSAFIVAPADYSRAAPAGFANGVPQ